MAKRPIFLLNDVKPYYREFNITFEWNGGFAKSQKQKNIMAMHNGYAKTPSGKDKKLLEISSKTLQEEGLQLSAFFLPKYIPSLNKSVPLECAFQAGKVFENGGPYLDLLEVSPKEAKKDERLKTSGKLIAFEFEGVRYPLQPLTAFYDYLYINACIDHPEISNCLLNYDGFTDIEFNPDKSLNCQARSAAIFVSLSKNNLLDSAKNFDEFVKCY